MINLCCSLLCSPDVLSKENTVLSNWKVFWKKNPKCFLLPTVAHLGSLQPVQMTECGAPGRVAELKCGSFLSSKASLQEIFALSNGLVFDFGETSDYVP